MIRRHGLVNSTRRLWYSFFSVRRLARMMNAEKRPLVNRWKESKEDFDLGISAEVGLNVNRYSSAQAERAGAGKRALDAKNRRKRDGKMAVTVLDHKMGYQKVVVNKAYLTSEWDAIYQENKVVMGAKV